jgi:hypothetical protein
MELFYMLFAHYCLRLEQANTSGLNVVPSTEGRGQSSASEDIVMRKTYGFNIIHPRWYTDTKVYLFILSVVQS